MARQHGNLVFQHRKLLSSKEKSLLCLMIVVIIIFYQLWAGCVPYASGDREPGHAAAGAEL